MAAREILTRFRRTLSLRHIRWWQWLLLLIGGIWIIVRTWLPEFIRQQVVTNLTTNTTAQIRLGDVDLNLLRGRLALQQLSFTLVDEEQPVLTIRNVAVNVRLRSLLRRTIAIETLALTGLRVEARQEANGQLNLTRLFPPTPPTLPQTEPTDLPTLTLEKFHITDSQITYQDRTRQGALPFGLVVNDLTAEQIALQPRGIATPVAIQLKGALNHSPLQGKAQILWQREQTSVDANIELQQLALTTLASYLQDALAFHKIQGQLGAQLYYRYQSGGTTPPAHALNGTVTIEQMQVADPLSQQTALTLPKGLIDIETIDLAQHNIRLTAVELRDLQVVAFQTPTGLNLASLIQATSQEQTNTASLWEFTLQTVKWTGGQVQYRDSTWPETETFVIVPEEIELQNLGSETTVHPFRFRTRISEGTLAGDGTLQLAPFRLQGQFQPADVEVTAFRSFLTALLPGKSLQGKVSGSIQAELNPQSPEGRIHFSGTLETAKFSLTGIPETGSSLSWDKGRIEIRDGSTLAPLVLHLQPQLSHVVMHRPSQTDLAIEQVSGTVALTSPVVAEGQSPVLFSGTLATTQFTLTGIPEAASELTWESSQLDIANGSTLMPLALEVNAQFINVALQRLPQGDVAIEKASAHLRLAQEESPQQEQLTRIHGPVDLTGFVLTQGLEKKILLGCYHATATIAEGSRLSPFDLHFPEVALEYTYAQGVRTPSGQFQLFIPPAHGPAVAPVASVLPSSAEATPLTHMPLADPSPIVQPLLTLVPSPPLLSTPLDAQPTAPTSGLALRIDRLSIIGGELYFEDRAVTPTQTVYWQDVRVNVNTLSYPLVFPATFSAFAYNEEGAPVEFQGTTEQRGNQTVMRVRGNIQKMSLARFNSYLEPSLGYRVKKGRVTATWDLVLPGDRIQANMKVTLHNIGLGGKRNQSQLEQQVGLPLALVIGLLKDLNGDIDLQLPMEGKLNEPGFQWGGTIVRAVRDVLIGAVTSPLKLLGAVFKGDEELEDFTFQPLQFTPGTNDMTKDAKAQLGQLSQFLAQRPGLDIRLSGMIGEADLHNLKDHAILAQLPPAPVSPPEQPKSTTEASAPPPPLLPTPQDEVSRFLIHQLHPSDHPELPTLSEPARVLLDQLRQRAVVSAETQERLIQARIQKVTTMLTTQHRVATTRIHVRPEKQRDAGAPAVRYVLQTRESETEETRKTPPPQQEQRKGEWP